MSLLEARDGAIRAGTLESEINVISRDGALNVQDLVRLGRYTGSLDAVTPASSAAHASEPDTRHRTRAANFALTRFRLARRSGD